MKNRVGGETYTGAIYKTEVNGKWSISARILTGNSTYLLYQDGKMVFDSVYDGKRMVKCVEPQDVPPFHDLENVIKSAVSIEKRETFDFLVNKCQGALFHSVYAGESYVICQGVNGLIDSIVSETVHVRVLRYGRDVPAHISIVDSCSENKRDYEVTKSVPWFDRPDTCLKPQRDSTSCPDVMSTSLANYTCIFLHGVGQESTLQTLEEWPEYWGQVHLYTPQCKVRKFIRQESKSRGWDDLDLQKEYCKLALIDQDPKDKVVRNKLLFVHSMGNMVLSAAIKNGICDVDKKTSGWYNIQGPVAGSKAAAWLDTICKENGKLNWPYKFIAEMGGYCVPGKNYPYKAYQTLDPKYPGVSDLQKIASERVDGMLCGASSYGLQTRYGIALYALSLLVGYGEDNDGMVGISSCSMGKRELFKSDYTNSHYLARVNHADGTSRNGDAWWGQDRRVSSWFTLRTK
jgi:hypothetical protein